MNDQPRRASGEMEELIVRYQNMVYGLALAKTNSPADADDVFQEVFLACFRSGKIFRDEEHRKAWLLRTTINISRRYTASTWRRKTVPLSEREDAPVPFREGNRLFPPGGGGVTAADVQRSPQEPCLPVLLASEYFPRLEAR